MKTSTKSTTLLLAALLLSLNIFANGIEFDQESYIDDIPFNVEEVINQLTYEKAIEVDFSFDEEEYIDDIPVFIDDHTSLFTDAVTQDFSFQEEEYIDDIPTVIVIQSCNRTIASTK